MYYSKSTYILALFTSMVYLSGSGLSIGPMVIRFFDLGVLMLLIAFVISDSELKFRRNYLFFYIVFGSFLAYSIVLSPFQPYPQTASIIQIFELAEYFIVFSIFSSLLIDKDTNEHEMILDTLLWITVVGSLISIAFFFTYGVRPVLKWYFFGFPAFGLYYSTARYATRKDWRYLIITLIILIRIIVQQSRSSYIFVPLAVLFSMLITYRLKEWKSLFSNKNFAIGSVATGLPVAGLTFFLPRVQDRLISIVQLSQGFLARPARWIAGLNVFYHHPFGIGLGNYVKAVQDFAISGKITYPSWFIDIFSPHRIAIEMNKYRVGNAGPHSDFFRLLIELGFVGGILILIFWTMLLKRMLNYSADPVSLTLVSSLIFLTLQQIVNSQLFSGGGGISIVVFISIFSTYELAKHRETGT